MTKRVLDMSYLDNIEKGDHVDTKYTKEMDKKTRKMNKPKTTGGGWFNMEQKPINESDLAVYKVRQELKLKKTTDDKGEQKFMQIGTFVDDPLSYYSSRLTKKQRGHSLTDELLKDKEYLEKQTRKLVKSKEKYQAEQQNRRRMPTRTQRSKRMKKVKDVTEEKMSFE